MNNDKKYNKRALTIKETSEYIGVSRGIIHHWLDIGILPYEEFPGTGKVKLGFRLIRKHEIERFLEKFHNKSNTVCVRQVSNKKISFNEITLLPRKNILK